jgi:hypothetical protein
LHQLIDVLVGIRLCGRILILHLRDQQGEKVVGRYRGARIRCVGRRIRLTRRGGGTRLLFRWLDFFPAPVRLPGNH